MCVWIYILYIQKLYVHICIIIVNVRVSVRLYIIIHIYGLIVMAILMTSMTLIMTQNNSYQITTVCLFVEQLGFA